MGAGCNHKHSYNKEPAFWVDFMHQPCRMDLNSSNFVNDKAREDLREDLIDRLQEIGYTYDKSKDFCHNKLFKVQLKSTYDGDGFVIDVSPSFNTDYSPNLLNLFSSNFNRACHKIINHLNRNYAISYSTSQFTSRVISAGLISSKDKESLASFCSSNMKGELIYHF